MWCGPTQLLAGLLDEQEAGLGKLAGPPPLEHRPTARPVMSSGQFEKAEISLLKEDGKVASRHMFGFEISKD